MHLKLLLLEDQEPDAAILLRVLQRYGMKYEATRAANREEFLAAIRNNTFDIILADNHLPQFSATGAMEELREHKITTPLILVTGTASEEFAVNMMKAGIADYILKDRLQRLPNAILGAIEKNNLEQKHRDHINTLIKNEALLKESERLAHLGSWETDMVNHITIWSDESYRILGYEPGEVEPSLESFLQRVHPGDREHIKDIIENAVNNGGSGKYECRIIKKNGKAAFLENNIYIAKNEQGQTTRINGIMLDVTRRKMALEQLMKSEANLKTIFNNTETGYGLLDTDLNILSFNQPMYKFSVEQMAMPLEVGKNAIAFFKPERRAIAATVMREAQKGITTRYEICYPQADGTGKWFDVNCHPAVDETGKVIGIVMSQDDVTSKKQSELQKKLMTDDLLLRNSVLEQFAYIVSHNLRGPMTTILGISDLMMNESLTEDEKQFFMKGVRDSVQQLDNVVVDLNSVLQFKNTENEHKQKVYFSDIVEGISAALSAPSDNTALSITTDFDEADSMITLKSYMNSIFYNLISNSIKFKQPGTPPVIEITSRMDNDNIALHFKDNGIGMDLGKVGDQLFGLFKRFHPEVAEGKGMGLFMVKTQVETLGGRIFISSEVNKGTQFTIVFGATG